MQTDLLKAHERLDDLYRSKLKIIQSPRYFCMGLDTVLLSHFIGLHRGEKVFDLGTGTGGLPLLLWAKRKDAEFTAIEIQEEVSDAAQRSVKLNGLEQSISVVCGDLREVENNFPKAAYSLVVSNPPYFSPERGRVSASDARRKARLEDTCTLQDVCAAAAYLLNSNGRFAMVHRPERVGEIFAAMNEVGITPKRLRFVQPNARRSPNILLIEGIKRGLCGLVIEPTLFVYDEKGGYTPEIMQIFAHEEE